MYTFQRVAIRTDKPLKTALFVCVLLFSRAPCSRAALPCAIPSAVSADTVRAIVAAPTSITAPQPRPTA